MKKSKLQKVSAQAETSPYSIVKLLLEDHKLLRKLMDQVKSQKASPAQVKKMFFELKKVVQSHVKAEERTFLALIKDHPAFEDHALESYEEHRVHEMIFAGIAKTSKPERKLEQMKIYCEILEHHLDEEEEDLFPKFKKIFASSTQKKAGKNYLEVRKKSAKVLKQRGAARYA